MKLLTLCAVPVLVVGLVLSAQERHVDDFFRDFTAEWVRQSPDLATSTRYFTGLTQDRLERQLTPLTNGFRRERIQLARKGLAELPRFEVEKMSAEQLVSVELMQWQLRMVSDEEPFLDYT